jgi:hypothetical protein
MDLKKLGVFCFLDGLNGGQVKQFAQCVLPLSEHGTVIPDERVLEVLAPR